MAVWQAIYPCRLMPFPSGVLPTNGNMPWNSSWKIHLIPTRMFLGHRESSVINMNLSRRGLFPSLSVTVRAGSLMDPWHHFWMMFDFHFYFFISLSPSLVSIFIFLLLPAVLSRTLSAKKDIFEIAHGNVQFWGSLICRWNDCITRGLLSALRLRCGSDESVNWYTCCYWSHKHVRAALKNISFKENIIKHCCLLLHANEMYSGVIYYVK